MPPPDQKKFDATIDAVEDAFEAFEVKVDEIFAGKGDDVAATAIVKVILEELSRAVPNWAIGLERVSSP